MTRGIELLARFNTLLILLLFPSLLSAQQLPERKIDSYVRSIINLTANENFDSAQTLINEFKSDYPKSPFPFIYDAANYINKKYSLNSLSYEDEIYFNLSKANVLADSLITSNARNIWNYYAKALTLGYWAYFEGMKENYFSAYDYGTDALNYYDKCLEFDSTFTDAIIANAIYNYWISEKLGWLPFVSDKRKEAIENLKNSIKKDSYNENIAAVSLFWILMNEKNYDEAREIIAYQSGKYPQNRYLIMAYANVEKHFDIKKSILLYRTALQLTLAKHRENKINEIILRHKIAMLEFKLKNYDNVLEQCKKILSYNLSNYEKSKLEDRLEKINQLKTDAERRKNIAERN